MTIGKLQSVLKAAKLANDTVIIKGVHGLGKSSATKQYARDNNFHCVELFLSHMEMGDVLGLPRTTEVGGVLTTTWAAPDWIQTVINKAFPVSVKFEDLVFGDEELQSYITEKFDTAAPISRTKLNSAYAEFYGFMDDALHLITNQTNLTYSKAIECVLFLDELNRAQIDVRQGTMQLILEKELHCHKLPYIRGRQTQIVAAINPPSDYQVDELDPALLDRFLVITVEADAKSWLDYARKANKNEIVRAYITEHPKHLWTDGAKDDNQKGASPRAWEKLSDFMDQVSKIEPEILFDIIKGKIGTATASTFLQFFNNYSKIIKLSDIEKEIKKHAKKSNDPQVIAPFVAKFIENQEAVQKSEFAEQFLDKYIDKTPEEALPLLSYLYALDLELLAAFLKSTRAKDEKLNLKLAELDAPNGKALFNKVLSAAKK